MAIRPQIPAIEGIDDPHVAAILGALKSSLEKITGRTPNAPQIKALGPNSSLGGVINKINELINRLQDTATSGAISGATSVISYTNSLTGDVALNNTGIYIDGPSVLVPAGTWFVAGSVSVTDGVAARFLAKLWDGTTVIDSTDVTSASAGFGIQIALYGVIKDPTANLKISVRDLSSTGGTMYFNNSGNSKDGTITAFRIG